VASRCAAICASDSRVSSPCGRPAAVPAGVHALLERARAWCTNWRSKRSEREVAPVGFGQALLADHARQHARLHGARVGGEQLVRERRVVGVGVAPPVPSFISRDRLGSTSTGG
jgi:hypothetical protein